MKVINLYGASGSGKSVLRADLFSFYKKKGYKVEEVTEFAKDLAYENHGLLKACDFNSQVIILGEQLRRVERLRKEVDISISDSPLDIGCIYLESNSKILQNLTGLIMKDDDLFSVRVRNDTIFHQGYGRIQKDKEDNMIYESRLDTLMKYDFHVWRSAYDRNFKELIERIKSKWEI